MSPVSRGRKTKRRKNSARRPATPSAVGVLDECECPECSGTFLDPPELIDGLIAAAEDLLVSKDPLDAEIVGASFRALGAPADDALLAASIDVIIQEFEARGNPEALALLLAIGSVADGATGRKATAAAERLSRAGVRRPAWAAELRAPVTVGDCWCLTDSEDTGSMLACTFSRAGRSHAVVIAVDHTDCGAADTILQFEADLLPAALDMMRAKGRNEGLQITTKALDPAEFRWQVEKALDTRAVHDRAHLEDDTDQLLADPIGPTYPALAVLLRTRMKALPVSCKPPAEHGDGTGLLSPLQMLMQLAGFAGAFDARASGLPTVAPLPAKRRKSDPPAPVYQIKVALRGAKPPIWRRLEVPADISLARLHTVIQIAFGWGGGHLHVFETPYGSFGDDNPDLGHLSDTQVTLEQVTGGVRSKVRYTYDFGDDWDHDIVIEKILDPDGTARYPRCTGGRRAAPPDDCGGIPGYAELMDVLNDPADHEHQDLLEWLGIDDAAEFDPASFDAAAVTRALSRVS